ncbi:poly-gamma-glutamate biosynthesis protein PgsC/CapC [Sporohalobacter salinus]|uniref:poly-gamma-glutamate biosynthesis protein PgsC/CapC n=1 Tax=Sporohalobacter salinus TaxID=1494606 RepID=UPI001EF87587|nr:poly-gamma-glutamate biosynthesis protein PgsC/CapC [Sporohalobacter salinus]
MIIAESVGIGILLTFGVALISYCIVIFLSRFIIIYSQRRFMASVIIGYLITWLLQAYFLNLQQDLRIVGYIVLGLIANNMIKQEVIKTLLVTITRLFLLLIIS